MNGRRGVTAVGATLIAVVALLGLSGPASAQDVEPVAVVRTDLTDFPTVRLNVALAGDAASEGIGASELTVTENGEAVDAGVEPLGDATIDVLLAIDVSSSMEGDAIVQARAAAVDLVDELGDSARVAVVTFAADAELVSDFTTDHDETREVIDDVDTSTGTALFDGISVGAQALAGSDADRSAMVVLSDGGDTASDATLDEATALLEDLETDFALVSLQTDDTDASSLDALAEAGGGQVVAATDPEALSEAFVGLGQRISNQYLVTFESTTPDPTATWAVTVEPTGDTGDIEIALPGRSGTATTEASAQTVPERLVSEAETTPLEQDWAMWAGAALIGIALAITAWAVAPSSRPRMPRRSLGSDRAVEHHDSGTGERIVESVRGAATRVGAAAVERSERGGTIDDALDRAGLVMRAGEFVAMVVGVAIAAALVLGLLLGAVGAALGFFVPILGAPAFLRLLARRRERKFADQLSDTLLLMAGSLRSGFGVAQSIDSVSQEMEPPIGAEFQRALLEMRLGRSIEDSLSAIARRMNNEDFEWVVDAIRINQSVGGDLAQILDQVSETIRARTRLRRQISALTAEGRLSGIVLGAMPIVMGLVLYGSNREYLEPLWQKTAGWFLLGGGTALLVAGVLWLKKLVDVEL